MSIASDKLRQMITAVPDQIQAIGNSISQIESQVDEIAEEISAIIDGACTPAESTAIIIIENIILPDKVGDDVEYGATFGVVNINWSPAGNLTDWDIMKDSSAIYSYTPGDYPDLDTLVDDFDFNNDYLTKPITDGASYGLEPSKANLEYAQSILLENQNKIAASIDVLNKYATGGS